MLSALRPSSQRVVASADPRPEDMAGWTVTGRGASITKLAALLIGLLAAVPTTLATQPETVRLRDLDFLDKLTNPCQIVRTGGLLPPSGRQERRGADELRVELRLASGLARFVRDASGVPECNGLHLDSQPRISDISGLPRRQAMTEMFRVFLYETAHLYLMAQEIRESHHTCGNESRRLVDELFSLAGRLQSILCVISENVPSRVLRPALNTVVDLTLSKFRDCQRRLMRNCLVLENTSDMLSLSLQYMLEAEEAQNNFLQPRLMVG